VAYIYKISLPVAQMDVINDDDVDNEMACDVV